MEIIPERVHKQSRRVVSQHRERLQQFVEQECIVTPGVRITTEDLLRRFMAWSRVDEVDQKSFDLFMARALKRPRFQDLRGRWTWKGLTTRERFDTWSIEELMRR